MRSALRSGCHSMHRTSPDVRAWRPDLFRERRMPDIERSRQCDFRDAGSVMMFALRRTPFGSVGMSLGGYVFALLFP